MNCIFVKIQKKISINFKKGKCVQWIYEYNLDFDHGSYTTVDETNKMFAEFKLYKMQQVMI